MTPFAVLLALVTAGAEGFEVARLMINVTQCKWGHDLFGEGTSTLEAGTIMDLSGSCLWGDVDLTLQLLEYPHSTLVEFQSICCVANTANGQAAKPSWNSTCYLHYQNDLTWRDTVNQTTCEGGQSSDCATMDVHYSTELPDSIWSNAKYGHC